MWDHTVILMYHRIAEDIDDPFDLCVTPERFAEQVSRVRRVADPIPLAEVTRWSARRRVAITFDDGYADNLTEAVPCLEAEDLSATVFVTSDLVEQPEEFWPYRLERLLRSAELRSRHLQIKIGGRPLTVDLGTKRARQRALLVIHNRLRPLPPAQIGSLIDEMTTELGEPENKPERRMLSSSELRQLASSPGITVGAHTRRHPWLSSLSSPAQREEIEGSRKALEALIEKPVDQFAYPFGGIDAFNRSAVRSVRQAGFSLACSTFADPLVAGTSRYRLPRRAVGDWSGDEFEIRLERWMRE